MGGRGSYSVRKAFGDLTAVKGTKTATQAAAAAPRPRGNFGGGADSGRQTEASMDAEFSNWKNSLSAEQISAFASYTNGGYFGINSYLRGKKPAYGDHSDTTKKEAALLKSAFNHALTKPITVYRGTGTTDSKVLAEMTTVGSVFRDKGAFSTSISRKFATGWAGSKSNPVVYTIRIPKGYKGAAWVQSISPHKHEKEVLIRPGQNWKVVKQLKPFNQYGTSIPHYLIQPV